MMYLLNLLSSSLSDYGCFCTWLSTYEVTLMSLIHCLCTVHVGMYIHVYQNVVISFEVTNSHVNL